MYFSPQLSFSFGFSFLLSVAGPVRLHMFFQLFRRCSAAPLLLLWTLAKQPAGVAIIAFNYKARKLLKALKFRFVFAFSRQAAPALTLLPFNSSQAFTFAALSGICHICQILQIEMVGKHIYFLTNINRYWSNINMITYLKFLPSFPITTPQKHSLSIANCQSMFKSRKSAKNTKL